jgi:hypothetical protein
MYSPYDDNEQFVGKHSLYDAVRVLVNPAVIRATLSEKLCPLHAHNARRARIGLGIHRARRFHIDAHGFRGWGDDRRGGSIPCPAGKKGNAAS